MNKHLQNLLFSFMFSFFCFVFDKQRFTMYSISLSDKAKNSGELVVNVLKLVPFFFFFFFFHGFQAVTEGLDNGT